MWKAMDPPQSGCLADGTFMWIPLDDPPQSGCLVDQVRWIPVDDPPRSGCRAVASVGGCHWFQWERRTLCGVHLTGLDGLGIERG